MKRTKKGSWWGLYALIPITVTLLYLAHRARVEQSVHVILLVAIVIGVPALALLWSEKHADLMGSEGVDARAEEESLVAAGITAGRFAPSLTARQAHYRRMMLPKATDESQEGTTTRTPSG